MPVGIKARSALAVLLLVSASAGIGQAQDPDDIADILVIKMRYSAEGSAGGGNIGGHQTATYPVTVSGDVSYEVDGDSVILTLEATEYRGESTFSDSRSESRTYFVNAKTMGLITIESTSHVACSGVCYSLKIHKDGSRSVQSSGDGSRVELKWMKFGYYSESEAVELKRLLKQLKRSLQ